MVYYARYLHGCYLYLLQYNDQHHDNLLKIVLAENGMDVAAAAAAEDDDDAALAAAGAGAGVGCNLQFFACNLVPDPSPNLVGFWAAAWCACCAGGIGDGDGGAGGVGAVLVSVDVAEADNNDDAFGYVGGEVVVDWCSHCCCCSAGGAASHHHHTGRVKHALSGMGNLYGPGGCFGLGTTSLRTPEDLWA